MKLAAVSALVATTLITLVAPQAGAQSDWEFTIAPYMWAAGMDGKIAVAQLEQDVDVPFGDVIEDLEFAFMGHFDMKNERWMVSSDIIYVGLGDSVDAPEGTFTADLDQTLLEVAGGYRVSPALALLVGARWVDLSTELRHSGIAGDERADASKSWLDPFVGAHVVAPLSDRWWIGLHGDVGGFGVGSDLAWQAYANIGWKASELVSIILGYRAIDMDYEDGSGRNYFNLDLTIAGPQLGVGFTF